MTVKDKTFKRLVIAQQRNLLDIETENSHLRKDIRLILNLNTFLL